MEILKVLYLADLPKHFRRLKNENNLIAETGIKGLIMNTWTIAQGLFKSFDNTELFYRSWQPKVKSNKAIILIHRGHEHSGRLFDLVNDLGLEDFWAFAWDARGHGNSPGKRGYAESVDQLTKDLDTFVKYLSIKYNIAIENIAVIANSIGGVIASAWVHDYAPKIRCMILAAPAFKIKLYVPLAIPSLRLLNLIYNKAFVKSYVKSTMLTHDPRQAKAYDDDKLIAKSISVKILLGFYDLSKRIVGDAGAITIPTQILSAGSDWVVKNPIQKRFFDSLSSKSKEMHVFPNFYHALLYEKNRHEPINKARDFILRSFKENINNSFLLNSDKEGFTKKEYDYLKSPVSFLKSLKFSFLKFLMATIGKLSKGISLGWKTGFDSGITLDYVYENKPQGFPIIGQIIDWFYLNSIGWKGIRQRKINIRDSLIKVIHLVLAKENKVNILDIASGPGRYILETINELSDQKEYISIQLRDNTEANLTAGKELAKSLNFNNVEFKLGDAFDEKSLNETSPKINVAIVSGLYELFPENEKVIKSLKGIYNAMDNNGYLIYTGQPWHPQVEMIARTLINRDGMPWIMRRRTQEEMDTLVENQGFTKIETKIDAFGIFTVSIAQKMETK